MNKTQTEDRSRTFNWADPSISASMIGDTSGLELLQALSRGDYPPPPVMRLLGMDGLEVEEGRVTVTMPVMEYQYNPLGTVHGGVLATLLDTATGCAVHSTLPAGQGYTSLDLTTRFIRPVTIRSETLRCEGTVISRGRRTAIAEARLTDSAGRLIAHATSTCMIFDLQGSQKEA
jgi:uncharacterized protein (TIGR00369 family)